MKLFLAVNQLCKLSISCFNGIYHGDLDLKFQDEANLNKEEQSFSNVLKRIFTSYQHVHQTKNGSLTIKFSEPGSLWKDGFTLEGLPCFFMDDISTLFGQENVLVRMIFSYSVDTAKCGRPDTPDIWSNEISKEVCIRKGQNWSEKIVFPIISDFKPFPDLFGSDDFITAKVTIEVTVKNFKHSSCHELPRHGEMPLLKSMLEDQVQTDVTMVCKNGSTFKCHKSVLAACSSVFDNMFKTDMRESRNHQVDVVDMTESGMDAFLKYIYYRDEQGPNKECQVALELLKAAHKYNVTPPDMESAMADIIISKPHDWFSVEMGVKLFQFARNLENGKKLKLKAAGVLKRNFDNLLKSPSYSEMFQKNQEGAMELCQLFASLKM